MAKLSIVIALVAASSVAAIDTNVVTDEVRGASRIVSILCHVLVHRPITNKLSPSAPSLLQTDRQLGADPWSDDGHSTAWSSGDDYYYGGKGGKSGSYGGKGGKSGGDDDDGWGGQYHGHWIYLPRPSSGKSGKTKGGKGKSGKSGSYDDGEPRLSFDDGHAAGDSSLNLSL